MNDIRFQVYENPLEKTVEFTPMHTWNIGEENVVEYTMPLGFDEAESDWVGIFKVNFEFLLRSHFILSIHIAYVDFDF